MRETMREIHGKLKNHCTVWTSKAATSSAGWL